jgi:hypothetical protein
MRFKEMLVAYLENQVKLLNTLCEENQNYLSLKRSVGPTQLPLSFKDLITVSMKKVLKLIVSFSYADISTGPCISRYI